MGLRSAWAPRAVILSLVLAGTLASATTSAARADAVFTPSTIDAQAGDGDIPATATGTTCTEGSIRPIDELGAGVKQEALSGNLHRQSDGTYKGEVHANPDATNGDHAIDLYCTDSDDQTIDGRIGATVHVTVTNGVDAGGTAPPKVTVPAYFNANRAAQDFEVVTSQCSADGVTLHEPSLFGGDVSFQGFDGVYGGSVKILSSAADGVHHIELLCDGTAAGTVDTQVVHADPNPASASVGAVFAPESVDRTDQTPHELDVSSVPCEDQEAVYFDTDTSGGAAFDYTPVVGLHGDGVYGSGVRPSPSAATGPHTIAVQCKGVFVTKGTLVITGNASATPAGTGAIGSTGAPSASGSTGLDGTTALKSVEKPAGTTAKLAKVLAAGGYTFTFPAPSDGFLAIRWFAGSGKHVLLAAAGKQILDAGQVRVKVSLTNAGKRLLKRSRHVKVAARETFSPADGDPAAATSNFSLKR